MIKAIIFDFGNVICNFDNSKFIEALSKYSNKSKNTLNKIIYKDSRVTFTFEEGAYTSEEFYKKIKRLSEARITLKQMRKIYSEIFNEVPGAQGLIRELKDKYKLGLLSNTSEWHYEDFIAKIDTINLFDCITTSYKVGLLKPNKEMYLDIIYKLKFNPNECLYIDDIKEYVDGAVKLGMNGIVFQDINQLRKELFKII